MQHIFIINPVAGRINSSQILSAEIASVFEQLGTSHKYEIYITECAGSGERFAREKAQSLIAPAVFYACGGDGTCNEVVNGIMGYEHAILGIIPVGSCNDFLKVYQKRSRFRDIMRSVTGDIAEVDVIKANNRYALNVLNIGYDAKVNWDCNKMALKSINIKKAYRKAIIRNLLWNFIHKAKFSENINPIHDGNFLLMTAANGQYYGNGIKCAPHACIDDGMLEVSIVKPISRLQLMNLFKFYRRGEHMSNPKIKDKFIYSRLTNVDITADKPLCVCLDGEIFHWSHVNVAILHKGIKILIPRL